MILKLTGYLSIIDDKSKKLIFEFIDNYIDEYREDGVKDKARNILNSQIPAKNGVCIPYDEKTFTVIADTITYDIRALVSRQVVITVDTRQYKFKSTREQNKGQLIIGTKLKLLSIDPLKTTK
jgi:hypothetical protein